MGRKRHSHRTADPRNAPQRGQEDSRPEGRGTGQRGAARRDEMDSFLAIERQSRARTLAVCSLLVLAVGLVFGQTVRHEFFNFDDNLYVYENRQVSAGLSAEGIYWAFADRHSANWHPLTWLSLMADCQVYGLHAGGHHVSNDVLHAATAVLLFLVLWRMTGGFWPSALVAAIFALHPLRVESVAWVTERKDVLSGLFFMLTLAAYVHHAGGAGKRGQSPFVRSTRRAVPANGDCPLFPAHRPFSWGHYLLLVVVFALGLLAKQSLVTLPLVLLLLDWWPLRRTGTAATRFSLPWSLIVEKIPLFLLSIAASAVAVWAASETQTPDEPLPFWWRIGNALISSVAYLGQFFCPLGLAAFYPRPGLDLPIWKICGAFFILAAITAGSWACRRRYSYLLMGWLWYLVVLLPAIGLVQVGIGAMADRFSYLPHIGLCIALVWGAAELLRRRPFWQSAWGIAAASVLAALMGCAWRQTSFWRDSETLWTHTLACTSQNFVAHNCLGQALADRNRWGEAIAEYREALEIKPDSADALNNLGLALFRLQRLPEAIVEYRKALEIEPDHAKAHNNLAVVLAGRGCLGEAIKHYHKALELKPDYAQAQQSGHGVGPSGPLRRGDRRVSQDVGAHAGLRRDAEQPGLSDGAPWGDWTRRS